MIAHRTKVYSILLLVGDFAAAFLAFLFAYLLREGFPQKSYADLFPFFWYANLFLTIVPIWGLTFFSMGLYEFWRGPGFWKEFWKIFKALLVSFSILGFLIFVLKYQFVSRIFLLFFFIGNLLLAPAFRNLIRRAILFFKQKNGNFRIYLIVGMEENARNFVRMIEKHSDLGLRVLGFLSPDGNVPPGDLGGYPILGSPQDLPAILENQIVDEVIFAISKEKLQHMEDLFLLCEERGITARVVLDFFPHVFAKTHLENLEGLPLLTFSTTPKNELLLLLRRIFDLCGSLFFIALLLPIFVVVALLIRLDSPGPAIYRQIRCGLNGRRFIFLKFRSMFTGSENKKNDLADHNLMKGPVFKMKNDPRVTRIGRFLRKTSLDELPQLINVLRGDMSFVGPRPPLPEEVAQYKGWQRRRLSMKPGITGLWQVSGRNLIDFDQWMKMDLEYIDNWSFWLDLKILVKTIPVVLLGKGAM